MKAFENITKFLDIKNTIIFAYNCSVKEFSFRRPSFRIATLLEIGVITHLVTSISHSYINCDFNCELK